MKYCMFARLRDQVEWARVSNPSWTADSEHLATTILASNTFNEYVQWENCGVEYRVVREPDAAKYAEPPKAPPMVLTKKPMKLYID